jgi:hypothetical protein
MEGNLKLPSSQSWRGLAMDVEKGGLFALSKLDTRTSNLIPVTFV